MLQLTLLLKSVFHNVTINPSPCSGSVFTQLREFKVRNVVTFWHMQDSSCSTVLGLCCWIFHFMMKEMFSIGEKSGQLAGQFSSQTLLL